MAEKKTTNTNKGVTKSKPARRKDVKEAVNNKDEREKATG